MKLLRMITKNLFLLTTVLVFAVTFIAVKKNLEKKTRVAIHRNLKKIVKLPTLNSSQQKKVSLTTAKKSNETVAKIKKPVVEKRQIVSVVEKKKIVKKIENKKRVKIKVRQKNKEISEKSLNQKVIIKKVSATELTHSDVIRLGGFNIKKPSVVNWVAYFDDYSKKMQAKAVADKVKTIQSKNQLKKKVSLNKLITIPQLSDLNLGYKSSSLKQYLEEYKVEQKQKEDEKAKKKKMTIQLASKKIEREFPKAIKKVNKEVKKIKKETTKEAIEKKNEKIASLVGLNQEANIDYSSKTKKSEQKVWHSLSDFKEVKPEMTNQENRGRSPAIVLDSQDNVEKEVVDSSSVKQSSVAKKIERENDYSNNAPVEKKHRQLDQIIEQMNTKFEEESNVNSVVQNKTQSQNVQKEVKTNIVKPIFKFDPKGKSNQAVVANRETVKTVAQNSLVSEGNKTLVGGIKQSSLTQEEVAKVMSNIGEEISAEESEQIVKSLQSSVKKEIEKRVDVIHKVNLPIDSNLKINVDSVMLSKGVSKKQSNFDIRFYDNFYETFSDHGAGDITIKTKLNNRMAVRSANVVLHGHIPTNTDLVFEPQSFVIDVPLIETTSMEQILDKNKLTGRGGHLLVQLDSERITEDARLDKSYEKMIYLDFEFKQVDPGNSDYNFLLFIGVEPGNALLSYVTKNRDIRSKIIFITENEVYFDTNEYIQKEKDEFELVENHLLGNKNLALTLSKKEINLLASNKRPNKKSLNRYVYKNMSYPLGTRQYSVLNHLSDSLFIGRWNNSIVEVPSDDYIKFIMDKFRMQNIGSQCVVQINLAKAARKIISSGRTVYGHMRLDKKILDEDGQIFDEVSENTTKIFLVGDNQGVINAKISYLDGSFDYLQTYCSEDTYLVEQM